MSTLRYVRARKKKSELAASQDLIESDIPIQTPAKRKQEKLIEKLESDFEAISLSIKKNLADALDAHTHIAEIKNPELRDFLHEQTSSRSNNLISPNITLLSNLQRKIPEEEEPLKEVVEKYTKLVTDLISNKPKNTVTNSVEKTHSILSPKLTVGG